MSERLILEYFSSQKQSKIIKTIHCAEFLHDNSLLTGDSIGNLTIWAPFEIDHILEFAIKEVKGHEVWKIAISRSIHDYYRIFMIFIDRQKCQLICLKLTKDNILISGDNEGVIKTWDVNENEFRLLNAIKVI